MSSLKDIAAATGVSVRTVGRALRQDQYVAPDTRQRVKEAVQKLDYRPHRMARSLRTGLGYSVTVIMNSVDELHTAKLAALQQSLAAHEYSVNVVFATTGFDGWNDFLAHRPVGVVVFLQGRDCFAKVLETVRASRLPVVLVDPPEKTDQPTVWINRPQGVCEAVHYLADRGYRHIGYAGPGSGNRLEGYRQAVKELGRDELWLELKPASTNQYEFGQTALAAWQKLRPRPDALLAYSDIMAIGMLAAAHEQAVKIPQELAVVGFDNRMVAALAYPRLTTVEQPSREIGQAAAAMLLEQLAKPEQPIANRTVATRLIVRETT